MGEQESKGLQSFKQQLVLELEKRVKDKILENENKELLAKLISNADSITEAQAIMALGTTYKRTGFHFDKRLEKSSDKIFYLKKNEELSFSCDFEDFTKGNKQNKDEAEAVEMKNCGFQARNKGVTKAVMTEVEGKESTIYRSNATPLKHTLIIGDNYPALQNLLITYKEKVKVIYIDPPYGKDDLGEFAKTNYHNAITRDNLLSMLYPRLQLAKELLKDDGVIFCSIDDKNQAYVKCLFDEVFGEENFVANLIWQKKKGGSQDSQYFAKEHETILCYQKRDWDINDIKQEQDEKDFNKIINGKRAKILKLEKWGNHSLRIDRPTLYYPIKDPNGEDFYPVAPNGADGCWRKKPENLDSEHIFWQKDSKGRLTPYEVIYFDEVKDNDKILKTRTIFTEYGTTTDATKETQAIFGDKVFDYPKPVSLIKHLLQISTTPNAQATKEQFTPPPPPPQPSCLESDKTSTCHTEALAEVSQNSQGDIVLDFFAGSGTTGHAVLELNREDNGNRQFILVTNNEITELNPNGIAKDVTSKRLKRIMSGECYPDENGVCDKIFKWREKNAPYGGILEVLEIAEVSEYEKREGKSAFEVIDETSYGLEPFKSVSEKIKWVCENFERAKKILQIQGKSEEEWKKELNKRLKNGNTSDN